jgi:8-oxo-dGTP pyrophosphatase MutT (NUDIX family)
MSAGARENGDSRLPTGWSQARTDQPSAKFFRLSQLRRLQGCEQVAAVCYRVGSGGIEFLLVQTRGGRWTFPKGSAEPGLTHAQSAALEAFEEAGVHGRMEEASFASYIHRKHGELAVQAHLCEVLRLGPPQESKRNRTWFSVEEAKRRLREDRAPDHGAELTRVVDRAVTCIERLHSRLPGAPSAAADVLGKDRWQRDGSQRDGLQKDAPQKDALQRVQFEAIAAAGVHGRIVEASFARYVRRQRGDMRHSDEIELAVNARLSQVLRAEVLRADPLRLGPAQGFNPAATAIQRLPDGTGTAARQDLPFAIDDARGTTGGVKASIGSKSRRNGSPLD